MRLTCLLFPLLFAAPLLTLSGQESKLPAIGVVTDLENAELLAAAGFSYVLESTQRILSPRRVSEAEFAEYQRKSQDMAIPLYGSNLFIPGELKVVGPNVDEEAILGYVDTVLRRAQALDLTVITWGSCGSRSLPDGFSRVRATAQFIHLAGRVAEVAGRYGITLVLENLNSTECNFITSVPEALAVVRAVDHPNLRLCVDIYHMLKDKQPASDIRGVGEYAVYSEIAERKDRTAPGVRGDDFTPYLRALKEEGYTGNLMLECRWDDLAEQAPAAYAELYRQVASVYR
ncbi:sugar phosphate isomerase/epimerase family protein [Lewinella sp. IMCC34183]|uniref:sugar phosphate isomerase/epimerase family protein n=1 Tax=Lewinella sp. IMCC34183 TaxID=2248762 RepID=UPI0013006947|nr:sugar phosphate isomerase/epimerase family protein [Lewinella sp. IMCC34183]